MIRRYAEAKVREIAPGVKQRTLGYQNNLLMSEVIVEKEGRFPLHSHPYEQIGTLISGRLIMIMGDEQTELGPGDTWVVPGGVTHGSIVLERAVMIDAFAPPREDYKD